MIRLHFVVEGQTEEEFVASLLAEHLGTFNMAYQTPEVGSGAVRALASNWRVSGILIARSGSRLNITSGVDRAFTGSHTSVQRPDQLSDDIYGSGKDASPKPGQQIDNYFNRDAFRLATQGTLGNAPRNLVVGPAFWQVDLAISKLVSVAGTQRLELRLETFNVFNTFNWGDPAANFNAATFGRILTQAGIPRILQFGVKYDF